MQKRKPYWICLAGYSLFHFGSCGYRPEVIRCQNLEVTAADFVLSEPDGEFVLDVSSKYL